MKVLIIGSGGREHALAWKCAQSPRVTEVRRAGQRRHRARAEGAQRRRRSRRHRRARRAARARERVDLTIVGPEGAAGRRRRRRASTRAACSCFGPRAGAAQLEGSKAFAKEFLQRHGIPTAASMQRSPRDSFDARLRAAAAHADRRQGDGLAAGKGVVIAQTAARGHRDGSRRCSPAGSARPAARS